MKKTLQIMAILILLATILVVLVPMAGLLQGCRGIGSEPYYAGGDGPLVDKHGELIVGPTNKPDYVEWRNVETD